MRAGFRRRRIYGRTNADRLLILAINQLCIIDITDSAIRTDCYTAMVSAVGHDTGGK